MSNFEVVTMEEFESVIGRLSSEFRFKRKGKKGNILAFDTLEEWVAALSRIKDFGYVSMSPGGVARMLGITRQAVNRRINVTGTVPCFVTGSWFDKYMEVPLKRVLTE